MLGFVQIYARCRKVYKLLEGTRHSIVLETSYFFPNKHTIVPFVALVADSIYFKQNKDKTTTNIAIYTLIYIPTLVLYVDSVANTYVCT